MKLKELETYLQGIDTFGNPKVLLEQYQTSPHLAARILYSAQQSYHSFEGKQVLDLGCGSGILTLGPILLGADFVLGVDLDSDALEICRNNVKNVCEDDDDESSVNYDLLQADITDDEFFEKFRKGFDVVIMNPPFGTKTKGVDMIFLRRALDIATDCVYSLHKSSTRDHITRKCAEWGVQMEVLAELRFDLPNSYRFHKKASVDIQVDFIRFSFD